MRGRSLAAIRWAARAELIRSSIRSVAWAATCATWAAVSCTSEEPDLPGPQAVFGLFESSPTTYSSTHGVHALSVDRRLTVRFPSPGAAISDALINDAPLEVEHFPAGEFTVQLLISELGGDQRVAAALIHASSSPPASWTKVGLFAVDSGTATVFAKGTLATLSGPTASELSDALVAELERTYVATWSWARPPSLSGQLVAFSTGWGDGAYPVYVGESPAGEAIALLIDCEILFPTD